MSYTSSWTSFLRSIASYNGDLSSLTAPPFILSPNSLLEYSQYWGTQLELLLKPEDVINNKSQKICPELVRMLAVIRWFIATLKSQYTSRTDSHHSEKKPLNPFLGEVFVAKFSDPSTDQKLGETNVIIEQVNHHSPVTGYAMQNKNADILIEGYNGVRASMGATSLNVKQYGHTVLHLKKYKEDFLLTLPPLHIEGLLTGSPMVELEQQSYIQSSSGYYAVFEYTGKGFFTGKSHAFKCRIYKNYSYSHNKYNALYTLAGHWNTVSYINKGYETPTNTSQVFVNSTNLNGQDLIVKPISEQHPLESRRAWEKVAEAIRLGNMKLISREKSRIENQQRAQRKEEEANGTVWKRRWFDSVDYMKKQDDAYVHLFKMAHLSFKNVPSGVKENNSKYSNVSTAAHWRFNENKFADEKEIHC